MNELKTSCYDCELLEQMFCSSEGVKAKYSEVNTNTIYQWLEDKRESYRD